MLQDQDERYLLWSPFNSTDIQSSLKRSCVEPKPRFCCWWIPGTVHMIFLPWKSCL